MEKEEKKPKDEIGEKLIALGYGSTVTNESISGSSVDIFAEDKHRYASHKKLASEDKSFVTNDPLTDLMGKSIVDEFEDESRAVIDIDD